MTDIDWVLLGRYTAGECTDAERAVVERWLAALPSNRAALAAIDRVAAQAERTSPSERRAARFAKLRAELEADASRRSAAWSRRWQPAVRIAAGLLLVVGASIAGYVALRSPSRSVTDAEPIVHTVTTARGQRMSLRLGDGTLVLLAPASTLRFAASFGAPDRTVELDGEAVFTVTHDERRPFTVRTSRFAARDLGTRFVVRAYPDDSVAYVAVAEGQVAVSSGVADSVILSPGDGARITAAVGVAVAHDIALESYFGWSEGRLVFRRASLGEALPQITRWHDVEIRLATPALATRRFSASFEHGESAAEMLQVIGAVLDLEVRQIDRRTFLLRAR